MIGSLFASFIATRVGKMLPPWVWELVLIALAIGAGMLLHHTQVVRHDNGVRTAQQTQDNAAWQKALAKEHEAAMKWKAGFDQQSAATVAEERKLNEKAVADDAALARALSLHGPGAASASGCRQGDHTSAAAAPDRHEQTAASSSASGSELPSEDGAIVPWNWLVRVLQEHDDMRADLQVIEDNDKKQRANWPGK